MAEHKPRIIVKVGSSTLTHPNGRIDYRELEALVRAVSDLQNAGNAMCLVSSGAIAVGLGKMGLTKKPADTKGKQALATIGQCELMYMYDKLFAECGHKVGQLLVTRDDVEEPRRRHNLINTFDQLFSWDVIPIVNENDAVAVEEIVFGDNDNLSAMVATLVNARRLIILTDIDGLYDANPKTNPDAKLIQQVNQITEDIFSLARGAGSGLGTGGMITKLQAADLASKAGIPTHIINSHPMENLYRVMDGQLVGTHFLEVKQHE